MNTLAETLRNALGNDVAEKIEAKSQAIAYFDLFKNNRRREGINPRTGKEYEDSHLQGRVTLPLARLKQAIAEAEAKGHKDIQVYCDLWFQHNGTGSGPMLTGKAQNILPDEKRFVPQPQNAAPTENDAPPSDQNEEPTQSDPPFTPDAAAT